MAFAQTGPDGVPRRASMPRTPLLTWTHLAWARVDWAFAALLGLASFALSFAHRPPFLNIWDSFLFANAAIEYDLLSGYPHPPGYPVFVFAVKIVAVFADPEDALELASMGFGALSVALLYGFLREIASRPAAATAAAVFAGSPLLFYNSVMSLSYTAECAASVLIAWLSWRARSAPSPRGAALLAVVFGLGSGLRTTVFLFLLPMVFWAVWSTREGRRSRLAAATAAGGAAVLLWLLPMLIFGGGLGAWLFTTRTQSSVVVFANTVWTHGWSAVVDQTGRLVGYLESEFAAILVMALVLFVAQRTRKGRDRPMLKRLARLVLVWVTPSLVFFTFVFSGWSVGPNGYALIFLPAVYVMLGATLHALVNALLVASPSRRSRVVTLVVSLSLALSPLPFFQTERALLIEEDVYDRGSWANSWMGLKEGLPPDETAILASHEWEFARWYFPEYTVWGYLPGTTHPDWNNATWHFVLEARNRKDDAPLYGVYEQGRPVAAHPIPPGIRNVVLTDFSMAGEGRGSRALLDDVEVKERLLPNGWRILYFEVDPERPTIESYLKPLGQA